MNCPLINESHVNVHHQHDDGDDSDEHVDGDEHEHGNGHGHDDGDSMMFPYSLPLVNAHDQQEGQGTRVSICLEEGAEEFLLKSVRLSDLKKLQHQKPFDVSDYVWLNMEANNRMLSTKGPNSTMEEGPFKVVHHEVMKELIGEDPLSNDSDSDSEYKPLSSDSDEVEEE
ncbi:Two-component response regulator ARR3 [Bienertia sinuspersici]